MKKRISLITLALVFGLFCTSLTWAGRGMGMRDGSMLNLDLTDTTTITGTVLSSGVAGAGLTIDEGNGVITTVYGMGPLSYWESLEVAKPTVGETVAIDALAVTFSDGTTRLIAVSLTIDDTFITLRTADGPAWRGLNKRQGQGSSGSGCRGNGSCNGTGVCPLTAD
jgi:hypothetical protein